MRCWCLVVTTAAAGHRQAGGGAGANPRDRTPRRPRFDIHIRAWFGPPPSPFALIKAVLDEDLNLASLREPDPEPFAGEPLVYHRARWETIRHWLELYDSHPAVARRALSDSLDTFD